MHPRYTWSRNDVGLSRSTIFVNFFHMRAIVCFFPAFLISTTHTDKNIPCFRCTKRHYGFGIFPIRVSIEPPQIVFPTRGTTTFPPEASSTNPPASRKHLLSAHDHGQLRSDDTELSAYAHLRGPDCTLGRLRAEEYDRPLTQSIATPEPGSS